MKTTSTTPFLVGMKSGNLDGVGQKWITFGGPGRMDLFATAHGMWCKYRHPPSNRKSISRR